MTVKLLDFMRICARRGLYKNNQEMIWKLNRLEKGQEAEDTLKAWIQEYIDSIKLDAIILQDVSIQKTTKIQIDLLVITRNQWWIIEVKNYNGVFQKIDNQTFLNDKPIERDEVSHCFTRLNTMKAIALENQIPSDNVNLSMIFMNENSEVFLDQEIKDIAIHTRNSARRHIREQLAKTHYQSQGVSVEESQKIVKHYQVASYFSPEPLGKEDFKQLDKGFMCPKCKFVTQLQSRKLIHCPVCGSRYKKFQAAKSAIEEISIILHRINPNQLASFTYDLLGGCVSKSTIRTCLRIYEKRGREE